MEKNIDKTINQKNINATGTHEDGCGWAPDGTFCGECSSATCVGCPGWEKKAGK